MGQYWSDFWDHNVDSVNAIEGMLKDMVEELANDEDVPGFIRDYMNGLIGADVPCNFLGVVGAGCRGVEEMLSGVYKGASSVLGHPCQTEENIADALIIAGEATKYFIEDPQKATKNAISSVSDWWNDKNTYEKIRTVVEAYIMYRMIASSGSKGETVTLESEEAGEAAEIATEVAKAGEVAEEAKVGAEVTEDAAKAVEEGAVGGKGKVKIESAGENNLEILSKSIRKHINKHNYSFVKEQAKYLDDVKLSEKLDGNTFFNKNWSEERIMKNVQIVYSDFKKQGKTGLNSFEIDGETIYLFIKPDGTLDSAYGTYVYTVKDFRR